MKKTITARILDFAIEKGIVDFITKKPYLSYIALFLISFLGAFIMSFIIGLFIFQL
jgi:hypothetical protein